MDGGAGVGIEMLAGPEVLISAAACSGWTGAAGDVFTRLAMAASLASLRVRGSVVPVTLAE